MKVKINILLVLLFLLAPALVSYAESRSNKHEKDFGDYVVHFNTFPSSFLDNNIAKQHGFTRSKNRILLNIVVRKKKDGKTAPPVAAHVTAMATNLTGQLKQASMRKIQSKNGIYYIGEFRVANQEHLNFEVNIKPEKQNMIYTLKFPKTFSIR